MSDKWELWQAKSEQQLAAEYILGLEDPESNAWWICRWQWKYSAYWRQLCQVHEAICLLAWETDPPELPAEWDDVFDAVAALNSNARVPAVMRAWERHRTVQKQTYWLKRQAIKKAMDAGLVFLRRVQAIVSCNRCEEGKYYGHWWSPGDEPDICRRCRGTGRARLEFIECNIANRYVFHQPYDSTHPFRGDQIEWLQPHAAGLWWPNQPGKRIDAEQASQLLTFLKRRFWIDQPQYVHEIYTYMGVTV